MLVRHGQVVAEGWWGPYAATSHTCCISLSKSFTSTAVGLAIAEGKLKVEDPVLEFLPRRSASRAQRESESHARPRSADDVDRAP